MFHNYVVQYPDSSRLVSIETDENPEFYSTHGNSRLCYSGKHDVYFNQQLHFQQVQDFKINTALVIMQWTSEEV